jgi:hypothetical protein
MKCLKVVKAKNLVLKGQILNWNFKKIVEMNLRFLFIALI